MYTAKFLSPLFTAAVLFGGATADERQSTPAVKASGAAKAPTPDAKNQADMAAYLDRIVAEKDTVKLAGAARKLGLALKASLDYDRAIAKLTAQERLLEQARVEGMAAAQDAARERRDLRGLLDKDLALVQQQFKDDAARGEAEQVAIVHTYLPSLQALKQQEEQYARLVRDTTLKLARVRRDRATLENSRKRAEAGLSDGRLIAVPSLPDWEPEDQQGRIPASPAPKESLQKALERLKGL